jgi:SWI/SNF-related matrix-associated actin-dependent regulator 1 of chromatin subfamily A
VKFGCAWTPELGAETPAVATQSISPLTERPTGAQLTSTLHAAQGLNLVGADTVILHDIDFNPQIDRQAEDRAHRIGQTRPVTIHRLVTDASVDENVYNIALRKKRWVILGADELTPPFATPAQSI